MIRAIIIYEIQIPTVGFVHFDRLILPVLRAKTFTILKITLNSIYQAKMKRNKYRPLKNTLNILFYKFLNFKLLLFLIKKYKKSLEKQEFKRDF